MEEEAEDTTPRGDEDEADVDARASEFKERLDSALLPLVLARAELTSPPALAVRIEESESELAEVDIDDNAELVPPPNTEASLFFQLDDLVIVCASMH